MHYCLCENGEYKKYTKKQRAKYNDNLPKYCFQNYKWWQSSVKNYFLSFRQLSHFPNNSFFSSCIVLKRPTSLKQRNRTFFPFHSPLALFWVNSCFPFDILRTYWITCIFWVRDVINCLRWLWTSVWGCGGVWIKCENWSDTCFITNALLDFLLGFPSFMCSAVCLLSSISFCFDSSFTTFLSPALLILLYQRACWTRHPSCLTHFPLCLPVRLGLWIGDNFRLARTHLCLPSFKCSLRLTFLDLSQTVTFFRKWRTSWIL